MSLLCDHLLIDHINLSTFVVRAHIKQHAEPWIQYESLTMKDL